MSNQIQLCLTLFSLAFPFAKRKMTLDDCLAVAKEAGYSGVEIVAPQMIPGFPTPEESWCDWWREELEQYNLTGYCYGSYVDMTRFHGRNLTANEIYLNTIQDLLTASKLGFQMIKSNVTITPEVLEKVAPLARELGIWIGLELHSPHHCRDVQWAPMFEAFDRIGHDVVGVVPDTGIFASYPHKMFLDYAIEHGVDEERLDKMVSLHQEKVSLDQAQVEMGSMTEEEQSTLSKLYEEFSPAPMEDLEYMLPYSRYIHGKFFYVDEEEQETCVPFDKIVNRMQRAGFEGAIAAEYEGYFHDTSIDSIEQIRRYSAMMSKLIS